MSRRAIAASIVIALPLAILLWTCAGTSLAQDVSQKNLLSNSDLKSNGGGLPTGWQVDALPPCGSNFVAHKWQKSDPQPGEIEVISDSPAESAVSQALTLEPGWYQFSAEINIETLGSAGASPELFAKSRTLPVTTRTHPMGFRTGWRKYQLFFKVGPSVREVAVGCALGAWGNPNTGRLSIRNPRLVAIEPPKAGEEFEDREKYDLQKLADSRFASADAKEAFSPPKYPRGRRWTMGAVYGGFLGLTLLGWYGVSPGRFGDERNQR
jgi:hypothetical protein